MSPLVERVLNNFQNLPMLFGIMPPGGLFTVLKRGSLCAEQILNAQHIEIIKISDTISVVKLCRIIRGRSG